ncbi:MAG: FMN-binding negative transcriptional regulator [Marinibacterium sp.]|nr:FMN-binding negative transcriptional regulator [Marinibacterium sp.]
MHPNPAFRTAPAQQSLAFARQRGFGVLALNGPDLPLMSHVPFALDADGGMARLHLVRSNPIARVVTGVQAARIAVSGPDSYISPDWYGVADQVPTWNYVAVHLSGRLERLPDTALRDLIDCQSAAFEARLAPKPPWTSAKMDPDALARMMRQIVPFAFHVDQVDGTWKLGQNKDAPVRIAAAGQVADDGIGHEIAALAALMRGAD